MARQCSIDPQGGPISVQLSVDNALISGGNFKIYDFNTGVVNEEFPLQTDTTGVGQYQVKAGVSDLVGQVLSWQINTCSAINTDKGTVNIRIFQGGGLCATTPIASYALSSVPNCVLSLATPLQGGLHFMQVADI